MPDQWSDPPMPVHGIAPAAQLADSAQRFGPESASTHKRSNKGAE